MVDQHHAPAGDQLAHGVELDLHAGRALTLALAVVSLFGVLYPNVMPNIDRSLVGLDIHNASSTQYTLKIMTIVATVFTPIVLVYQAWTYWVFRKRVTRARIEKAALVAFLETL